MSHLPAMIAAPSLLLLGACVYEGSGDPPPLAPLAADRDEPVLALFERALAGYFSSASPNPPTTCAQFSPAPLTAAQEEALILRFVRLAPAARCRAEGSGVVDSITGEPAALVQVYEFRCANEVLCTGWVTYPSAPSVRHTIRYREGFWRDDADPRIILTGDEAR
jgi:hypothetical protein